MAADGDQVTPDRRFAPLEAILCTEELWRRPRRPPDFETENKALGKLVSALAQSPRTILQTLADTLLEVFNADSAGISLLTADEKHFHWAAIAGAWAPHIGGGTPREFGPCGDVLDRKTPLLFRHWEVRYPYLAEATPLAEEGLLVPFFVSGKAVGTVWTIAHDRRRRFDAEDLRQLESIGRFASAAYQTVKLLNAQEASRAALDGMDAASRSKHLLEAIIETTPDCIKIVAPDGTLLRMNAAGREMIELGAADLADGACILDLIAPEFREGWQEHHHRVCAGEKLSWEFDLIGLKGTRRHMETRASPIRLPDGMVAQLAVTRDVTQRKLDELKIRESEHRFHQLLQALPAAVYTTDAEGRITFFNEAAVEFAGRRPEIGEFWCVTWRLHSADGAPLPHDECPMAIALRQNRPIRGVEAIAERPDGSRRWFAPYPTPLRDSTGRLVGAINMLVDITERKQAEAQQKLLIDELNHRVKNTLATVQSLVAQTARGAGSVDEFRQAVEGRILALSHAHNQLSRRGWVNAEMSQLLRSEFEPYLTKGNVALSGAPLEISPNLALMLSMAVHELATNAAKYGALASSAGRIEVSWRVEMESGGPRLRLFWIERNGPPVVAPKHQGFGMRLLERGIQAELEGETRIEFAPDGVRCEIHVPLTNDDA
ncbi:HWE histidine kinase domain-containing protein [Methylocystis echinoides]|jgi:PAS domain S-box-containing protein|uniref:HWE histidine kinase domain-containing protein n=1 Tax=Methylocystis echinoides TaxID=29468 RepID=UPI0034420690